jgi:hypothetical protein
MATKTLLVDDMTGEDADVTITYSIDDEFYSIDLTEENAQAFRKVLAPYIEVSAVANAPRKTVSRSVATSSTPAPAKRSPEELQAIRDWARANGYEVADRGRIKADIVEAFEAAHS